MTCGKYLPFCDMGFNHVFFIIGMQVINFFATAVYSFRINNSNFLDDSALLLLLLFVCLFFNPIKRNQPVMLTVDRGI